MLCLRYCSFVGYLQMFSGYSNCCLKEYSKFTRMGAGKTESRERQFFGTEVPVALSLGRPPPPVLLLNLEYKHAEIEQLRNISLTLFLFYDRKGEGREKP